MNSCEFPENENLKLISHAFNGAKVYSVLGSQQISSLILCTDTLEFRALGAPTWSVCKEKEEICLQFLKRT